ncbi:PAS domain S-box protein [Pedobacter ginsengisoli]|uniref:PAS domain S-box protein n=1 Tax=Pedobacter ginsengisoli TaxID=363852 RepID=UPI0025502973|nr:PAS domain S-box protein [Pedobacter ginsengisoli]
MGTVKKTVTITGWLMSRPALTGLLVFLVLLILIGLITNQRYHFLKETEHHEIEHVLDAVKQNVEQRLRDSYTTALTLALTIRDNGEPENFEAVAAKLIDSNSSFLAVQLVPNGIIKYIYPLKGNEGALNANIFTITDEHSMRARQSIRSGKMYFTGPNQLKQGGIGIVGRLPVYNKDKFWGFSAVVIRLDTFLKETGIAGKKNEKFYFQFSRYNISSKKEEFFLPGDTSFSDHIYGSVAISDGNWKIYLVSKNRYDIFIQLIYSLLFGLSLAILNSLLITKLLKKHLELQNVVDNQASKLIETEMKFKTIFEEAPIGIALISAADGRFLQVNKELCKILGYTELELFKLSLKDISYSDRKKTGNLQGQADLSADSQNRRQYIHKNGSVKWANLIETPLLDETDGSESNIMILEDVTDRNNSINMITEQNKRLLNFSYIVSHNLRSHTSNIQAIAGLIEQSSSEQEKKELVALLKTVSASLDETMVNLNNVVNIQTSIDVITVPLNLSDYIGRTLNVLRDQINVKSVDIRNDVPADTMVNYNPAYLESVLLNFIFNAIRYSHPDRRPLIRLNSYRENDQVVLEVSDNGIGIDLDKFGDQLFGMYKTFTENPDSKGLGLFISKNQIDAMSGMVTVQSVLDEGTTFKIYFK